MIESYIVLAGRIRKELDDLERLVSRATRAINTAKRNPKDTDLYIDSASLNLHDIYSGFERVFKQGLDLPKVRPPVLTSNSIQRLDEYLRFRHVVRNVYTFSFDPERIGRLVEELEPVFHQIRQELLAFAGFLEKVGME